MAAKENEKHYFLQGGGEMGKLVRAKDWQATPLGDPEFWPQSLKTATAIMLENPFGMYIAWGSEFTQLYNDAYRPILGASKHPKALGISTRETFSEIWHIIGSMFDGVMSGKAVGFPNFMLPLNRNGFVEACYFDFSYSPIRTEDGSVGGILVTVIETTTKKKTEDALRESEQRFRTMAENSDILISVADSDLNTTYFNKAWADFTGRPVADLLHFGWEEIMHPDDKVAFMDAYKKAIEKKESFAGEFRMLHKDGNYRWLLAKIPARYNADGSHAGYVSSCVDITERKIAEEKLKESENRVRSVVESAPFPIGVYVGENMNIEVANQAIVNVYGKGNDVLGKSYLDLLPELKTSGIFEQLRNVYRAGIPFHAKNQRVDIAVSDEVKSYYFNYSFVPLYDTSGKIYGVMNTAADVTDLNLAKQMAEESEDNLRNIILQAPVAMCIFRGPEYIVEIANEKMFELWGKAMDDVINKPIFEGLPEAKNQGFEDILNNVYNTGKTFSAQARPITLPRKGQIEIVYVNFVYEAFKDAEGSISGIMAVAIDVTEQVLAKTKIEEVVAQRTKELANANRELQHTNIELARSNANLEEFAYAASHDMKEPVRKIHFFSDRLKVALGDRMTEDEKLYFGRLEMAARRMATLIDDLLSYSKVSIKPREKDEVNLNQLINIVLSDLELEIEEKKAVIIVDDLCTTKGYPRQLQQAFQNLISNSLKYVRRGTVPEIEIKCEKVVGFPEIGEIPANQKVSEYIRIDVKDNGLGFDQKDAERIFNVFTRLHTNAEYRGTGIGLSIVRKVIENHGGFIKTISELGKGSVFSIFLPA